MNLLEFRVQGLRGLGSRAWGFGVEGLGFGVWGFGAEGFGVWGLRVYGMGNCSLFRKQTDLRGQVLRGLGA